MRKVDTKFDGTTSMPAANYNAQRDEVENAVESADITLDPDAGPDTDLNMLGKAIAGYANAGAVYQDSGIANAYVLSIASNLKSVTKYYSNMMIVFKAGNSSTGVSTINVNTLGVKSVTLADGTALSADDIVADRYTIAVYNLSNDRFELASVSGIVPHDHSDAANGGTTVVGTVGTFLTNSAIGLIVAGLAEMVDLDLGTVTDGDVFLLQTTVTGTKGGTAGDNNLIVAKKSGTATVTFLSTGTISDTRTLPISGSWNVVLTSLVKVTGSGTLVMKASGTSSGSNTTSASANLGASFSIKQ